MKKREAWNSNCFKHCVVVILHCSFITCEYRCRYRCRLSILQKHTVLTIHDSLVQSKASCLLHVDYMYNSMAYPNPLEYRSTVHLCTPLPHPKRYTCQIVNFHQPSKFKIYNMTHMSEKLWQFIELFLNSRNTRGL